MQCCHQLCQFLLLSFSIGGILLLGTLGWFGRDCFWTTVTSKSSNHSWFRSFCRFHSKSELLVMAVYPLVGGVSGNISKNRASDTLKGPRAVRLFTCRGRRFHSLAAFTPKEFS